MHKALEISPVLVELGSEGMHLMVRHHLLHIPHYSEPAPASYFLYQGKTMSKPQKILTGLLSAFYFG
jgi:hypothetical protein